MDTSAYKRMGSGGTPTLTIRPATAGDIEPVVSLDAQITAVSKPEYWRDLFGRYGTQEAGRHFLVAMLDNTLAGFIIGEVRAWEFGSPPCGWVFALTVDPEGRLRGVGTNLFEAICGRFRDEGVTKIRTMVSKNGDAKTLMSFFRSQGMMAGPFIELEKDLAP
ncbi:GNAT family N-acetyltransferase [Pararhodospirillum photometricum]|uniref:GNAT family N-acetyltransferase n=1 Tax=Pararhodospirillum photometricum TaxID=1084 RepID=UPI0003055629|nr:GNAT family N-acetyltransferase [Pararhodospirillum photometricum]